MRYEKSSERVDYEVQIVLSEGGFIALFVFHPVIDMDISFTLKGLLFVVQVTTFDCDDILFVRRVYTTVSSTRNPSSISPLVLTFDEAVKLCETCLIGYYY